MIQIHTENDNGLFLYITMLSGFLTEAVSVRLISAENFNVLDVFTSLILCY